METFGHTPACAGTPVPETPLAFQCFPLRVRLRRCERRRLCTATCWRYMLRKKESQRAQGRTLERADWLAVISRDVP